MEKILEEMDNIAKRIKDIEKRREMLGKFLRNIKYNIKIESKDVEEKNFIVNVVADELVKRKVIGIDGGLSKHAYHGIDLVLTRAVAAIFDYNKGVLVGVNYFPSALSAPKVMIISDPFSDEEFIISSSLERQKNEIDLAAETFKKFSPDMLLLDGSVIPHGSDRPGKNSQAYKKYADVLESFRKLYKIAQGKFAGCVEDSRGRRFCEIVAEQILPQIKSPLIPELQKILAGTRDTNLLYHVLDEGERTCIFKFSKEEHPITEDLGCTKNIFTFYLKTAEFDRPIRIDFFAEKNIEETANYIASLVLATACHSSYGFPAPLVEADLRAKLMEKDADMFHNQLVDRIGITPSLMKLRREQRPF